MRQQESVFLLTIPLTFYQTSKQDTWGLRGIKSDAVKILNGPGTWCLGGNRPFRGRGARPAPLFALAQSLRHILACDKEEHQGRGGDCARQR